MSDLRTQPSKAPTRKMMAMIIATFCVQGAVAVIDTFAPGMADVLPAAEWIAMLVPLIAGYMTRDRA